MYQSIMPYGSETLILDIHHKWLFSEIDRNWLSAKCYKNVKATKNKTEKSCIEHDTLKSYGNDIEWLTSVSVFLDKKGIL